MTSNNCFCEADDDKINDLLNNIPDDEELYDFSEILKAIADPTRLKILYLLKNEELCVCEINSALNKPQSTISNQLKILKKSNLLKWRKEGKWTYYKLSDEKIVDVLNNLYDKV